MDLFDGVLLHLGGHARRDRGVVDRALPMVVRCRLVCNVSCFYCEVVFALINHRRAVNCRILLILALLMVLQFGVHRILVTEGALVAQIPYTAIGRAVLRRDGREGGLMIEAEFQALVTDHLLGPLLNYLPLLPNAQLFQVLEADAHLGVEVG